MVTIRRLTKTLQPLGVKLRVALMVFAMAFSTVGLTFQACQCDNCECSQDGRSCCCCSEASNCCSCESDCDCGNSDSGCSCGFCMCTLGVEVEPTSLPRINNSVNPMVFKTTISLTSVKPFSTALFRPARTAVTSQPQLYALHCRWLI